MQFIHLATVSSFLLALTHAAPTSDPVADLRLICEVLPDQCPTAILKALESLPTNTFVSIAPSGFNPPTFTSASANETSPTGTSKI
jgi:hypothetical protein